MSVVEFGHRLYAVSIYEVSRMKRLKNVFGTCLMLLLGTSVLIPTALGQKLPSFGNVVIVLGENQNYTTTYNSKNMPYLTLLGQNLWTRS